MSIGTILIKAGSKLEDIKFKKSHPDSTRVKNSKVKDAILDYNLRKFGKHTSAAAVKVKELALTPFVKIKEAAIEGVCGLAFNYAQGLVQEGKLSKEEPAKAKVYPSLELLTYPEE